MEQLFDLVLIMYRSHSLPKKNKASSVTLPHTSLLLNILFLLKTFPLIQRIYPLRIDP